MRAELGHVGLADEDRAGAAQPLDEEGVDETLRIRYRWLDLRRDQMQRNIRTRARAVSAIRREMEAAGFVDIETPIMGKPTPEGARDFLVPTRLQPGRFFALPQSPQIYKQLLVISGHYSAPQLMETNLPRRPEL